MQDNSSTQCVCEPTGWRGLAAMETMTGLNKTTIAAMLDFNASLCSRMGAINGEWAAFVGKRLTEDFKLFQQVAACRSPDQLFEAYGSFLRKAFEQYEAEFAHMLKLGQAFASLNADLLKDRVDTALREVTPRAALPAGTQRERATAAQERRLDPAA